MTLFSRLSIYTGVAIVLAGLSLASCGGSSTSPSSRTTVVLLDTTLPFVQGVTCATGGVTAEFIGTAGKIVVIAASGAANLTPRFTLYAPDFATQLAGSTSTGAGAAGLTFTLTLSGQHHVTLCDLNGVPGAIRVTVTQQ